MKVAIVHDWLVVYGGAERVLEQMLEVYPEADIFSTVDDLGDNRAFIKGKEVHTTFIQDLPFGKKKYRSYLPLMPIAIEQLDLSQYDLIISSSSAVAKGVLTGPDQLHICMCYSPIRYAWDLQHQYLRESGLESGIKSILARYFLHKIRVWDVRTSNGVDAFISISKFIERRIMKVYGRESTVIYPPVYVDDFETTSNKEDFYVTASRMVPYKKIDLIVDAFTKKMPDKKLVVIGDGPDFEKIKSKSGTNVELLGFQNFATLKSYLSRAKAFVFAAEEDFGIAPLEAQASGTPVIAYGKGGALETVVGPTEEKPTGVFFYEQSVDSIKDAIDTFENISIGANHCVENARRFSADQFKENFKSFVDVEIIKWRKNK